MSTILKALRRLEQERSKDTERPLKEEVVYARPRSFGPSGSWGLIGVALVVGFAVTWAVLPSPSPDAGDEAATPAPVAAAPVVSPLAAAPPTARPVAPPLPAPVAARGALVADPAAVASPAPAPSGPLAVSAPVREPMPPAPEAAARVQPIAARQNERVVAPPIEGRASRLVDEDPAPRRASADIPVRVVRTSWHPRADRRAAWVAIGGADPHEVREGEWVGSLEIRTIEPDGILFADGPILVHRRIGER